MTDIVRVALLGVIALGVAALYLMYSSLRGQIDSLRAEVACLRIERITGKIANQATADEGLRGPRGLGTGLVAGALIGAATTAGAAWVLMG
ncbi:hypothetical protein [Streptomyces roseolus]|uniref:hypothetical protein n=1 Tax=Streptomyces roseolus TaxID=67358 RepID=UPI0036AB39DC